MAGRTRIEWPDDEVYRKCGQCSRCTTDVGRDKNPAASDCYDDMLNAALQPARRSA